MSNETIIAVPANIAEPVVLKRFLDRLIERLDIVFGFRGDSTYVTNTQLAEGLNPALDTLTEIAAAITQLQEDLVEQVDSSTDLTETVQNNSDAISTLNTELASSVLDSTYHDFDDAAYATLVGNGEFSTLGSNITNAPYIPVGGETYYNYINSVITNNGGVVQVLRAYSTASLTPTVYTRFGDDWTTAKSNGWI